MFRFVTVSASVRRIRRWWSRAEAHDEAQRRTGNDGFAGPAAGVVSRGSAQLASDQSLSRLPPHRASRARAGGIEQEITSFYPARRRYRERGYRGGYRALGSG